MKQRRRLPLETMPLRSTVMKRRKMVQRRRRRAMNCFRLKGRSRRRYWVTKAARAAAIWAAASSGCSRRADRKRRPPLRVRFAPFRRRCRASRRELRRLRAVRPMSRERPRRP